MNPASLTRFAGLLAALLAASTARGQTSLQGSGNKLAGYYPAPHQTQMWWLLEGASTQSQPDGRLLLTDARMQTFTKDGARELAVRAPQCWYSRQAGTLSSPGPMQAAFANGDFTLEGEGFLLHQTNLDLNISNRVHTHISGALLGKKLPGTAAGGAGAAEQPSSSATEDLEVFSDQFNYATNTGRGIYRENVRVAGTNLALTSRRLTVVVPTGERRLESISAEGEVKVDSAGLRAAGEQADYTVATDQVHVTGHPSWHAADKEGSADDLVLERTNGVLHATGNAALTAQVDRQGGFRFLSRPAATNTAPAARQVIEIHSESYSLQTNYARFNDHVRAEERADDHVEGTMTCARLTVAGAGTNALATAEGEVDLRQTDAATGEKRRFTSGQAVFSGATEALELTLLPKWEAGDSQGSGNTIVVATKPEGLWVTNNAFLSLPADQLAGPPSLASGEAPVAKAKTPAQTFAQIYSESYRLTPGGATFQGPVRIIHPEMGWKAGKLSVDLPKGSKSRRLLAEDGVAFDLLDARGGKHHGTGDKAELISGLQLDPNWTNGLAAPYLVAGRTNQVLVLTGDPALLADETGNIRNRVIIVDGSHHRVTTPGKYLMWGKGPAISTNKFELPKSQGVK